VFPSIGDWGGQLEVAYEEGRRCMQNCWFSQTLQTRQPSHYISTILTPVKLSEIESCQAEAWRKL